jgi:hypothetical protein
VKSYRGGDAVWPPTWDAAFGVYGGLAGISLGQGRAVQQGGLHGLAFALESLLGHPQGPLMVGSKRRCQYGRTAQGVMWQGDVRKERFHGWTSI